MVTSLQRFASGNIDPVALLRENQQRKSREALQAEQLRAGADLFAKDGMTPFTAIAKGLALGLADRKEAKDQDRKDAIQAEIDKITTWRQQQAEHKAEMQNMIDAGAYMQAQQPVFAQGLQLLDATGDGSALDTALRGSNNWMALVNSKLNGADFVGTSTRTLPDGTKVIVANGRTPEGETIGVDIVSMDQGLMNLAPDYVAQRAEEERAKALNDARVGEVNARTGAAHALADQRRASASNTGGTTFETIIDANGEEVRVPVPQQSSKPMPASAIKLQNDTMEELAIANNIQADLASVDALVAGEQLNLGLFQNWVSKGRNVAGMSDENSRNFQTFQSTLEKLRNDSLRLNKGVQTEGDAQRAWNELLANINDEGVVRQRLKEIQNINARAADLKKLQIDTLRNNYGQSQMDYSRLQAPAAIGANASDLSSMSDAELEAIAGGAQ